MINHKWMQEEAKEKLYIIINKFSNQISINATISKPAENPRFELESSNFE